MNTSVKISVIIPVYNSEKYICECLNSILSQTYKNIEVIVVDDGSTDNSPIICDNYAKDDSRIIVVHKKNEGASSARNVGINIAKGEYYLFVDSDDYLNDTSFLLDALKKMETSKADVTIFGIAVYSEDSSDTFDMLNFERMNSNKTTKLSIKQLIKNDLAISSPCNKLIKSTLFADYNLFFNEQVSSEDIDWNARLLICANSFDVYPESVYIYRQNQNSITHNISEKNINDLYNNIVKIVELSETIKTEDYYKYYMNYCSYQYITLLNLLSQGHGEGSREKLLKNAKEYSWLLKYHINKKVKLVYYCNKLFGFGGMMKTLGKFLKGRSRY